MLEGGSISRESGEPATGPLLALKTFAGPELVRCTYLKGDWVGVAVAVLGVVGPREADRGAFAVLPAPVGDSSELISIVMVYCCLLLPFQLSRTMRLFHRSPIALSTLLGNNPRSRNLYECIRFGYEGALNRAMD
jgi:hypothetical protein